MPDDRPSAGDTSSPGRPHRRTRFARAYGLLGLWVLGRRRLVAIGAAVVGLVAALLALHLMRSERALSTAGYTMSHLPHLGSD